MPLSQRAMAAALGVSKRTVEKRIAQGMPMDSAEAARSWTAMNVGEPRGPRLATSKSSHRSQTRRAGQPPDDDPEPAVSGLEDQKTLNRKLTAARINLTEKDTAIRSLQERQAKMDADLRDGKLLRAEDEYRKGFERATGLRQRLLSLPAEWAVQLAAISDPALVADFTRKRIKATLIEYCAAYGVTAEA